MEVYRITLSQYADQLYASGRENRWNLRGEAVIYTASSRSLACLENVVHSSGEALSNPFTVLVIYVPDDVHIVTVNPQSLPPDWTQQARPAACQQAGSQWVRANESAVLRTPSAIIPKEYNYLLNPQHPDFTRIRVIEKEVFIFDARIKQS